MTWWIFQHLVVTAALAAVVVVVSRLTKIGPVGRHALWLVVLIKFVMPPLVAWPWAMPDPWQLSALEVSRVSVVEPAGIAVPGVGDALAQEPAGLAEGVPRILAALDVTLASAWPWLAGIWLVGSLLLVAVEGVRILRLARLVRASAPAGPGLACRVAALSDRLGLRPLDVRVVPGSAPPAVWCLGRPRLLWPADMPGELSDACLDGLVLHELAHVRRHDHLVGWIELAGGALWWWNPVFWFVRSARREAAELACDAWVIDTLPHGRRAYAESLLALSGAAVPGTSSIALVGIGSTSRRMLERRLVMIMQARVPVRLKRVGLVSLAIVAAATLPGWARAEQSAAPSPAPVLSQQVVEHGRIQGRVINAEGVGQPGVTITLASDALVRPMVDVTSVEGRYEFPIVPKGTYDVSFELEGFKKVVRANVIIETGFNAEVNASLGPVQSGLVGRDVEAEASPPPALSGESLDRVTQFEADRQQILDEAQQRVATLTQQLVAALQSLEAEYIRDGRTDEAAAIRHYLETRPRGGGR